MASGKMRCVFCKGKNDKIILFVGEKLKNCQEVLRIRMKYKLKYYDTELPAQINNTDGYHRQCYSSFTALIVKYRDSSSGTYYASNFSSPTLSSNTPVDISETIPRNVTLSSNSEIACEVASSSSNSQITSGDSELSLKSKIKSEDVSPSSNDQSMSGHPHQSFKSKILSEESASSLDNQTTSGDVASSSTCDLNINENTIWNEISDTNIEDIETGRQHKNVCFFCDKFYKMNKGKNYNLHSSNKAKHYDKIIVWMKKLNNKELLQKIIRFKSTNRPIFYHNWCELNYLNDYKKVVSNISYTSWHKNRNRHKKIFNHIVSTIKEEVLKKRKCVLFSSLYDMYNNELEYEQKRQPSLDINLISNYYLEEKIRKHFKRTIKIGWRQKRKIVIHNDCSLLDYDLTKLDEMMEIKEEKE